MGQILGVTFPFFALVFVGWGASRRGMLPAEGIAGLNIFVLFVALPAMLYCFAAGTPILRLLDPGVSVTYLACALTMVTLTVATTRAAVGWNDASFGALAAAFPNSGFMGVPLLVALLGPTAAGPAIVCLAIDMVFTSSVCVALSRLDGAGRRGVGRAMTQALHGMSRNPLPWAILLGTLSAASGVKPPPAVMRALTMLSDAASPVALFTLGAMLARSQPPGAAQRRTPATRNASVPLSVFAKLVLHPLLAYATGKVAIGAGLPLDDFSLTVLVLAAALPSASNVPMLAQRFGADAGRVARIVFFTTVAAFASFSAAVALLR